MRLNNLKPAEGSKKQPRRLGRGIGCTLGKTCGKGHKGQKARAGGFHKVGFEGGQMPLQRRLPKIGFNTHKKALRAEVTIAELAKFAGQPISIAVLKQANLIPLQVKVVSIIDSGNINAQITVASDIRVTKGAKVKIEAAGGKVEV
ncbi:large subunit ribosomal protein L15 [Methylomagnum ishizawai]|uniref:Large ribosomal subunit protein uL15 n=1 Tax=Methylomagnum ishizawai TaxID=1760988 RepID=A0A1Y6D1F3_9GAMM|nr:50S ribosomal protein L15 [Methylomagnum ishizawai]SMF96758.1 large subunit ribosomal protein L15 [Methylomagnum ishizawai]